MKGLHAPWVVFSYDRHKSFSFFICFSFVKNDLGLLAGSACRRIQLKDCHCCWLGGYGIVAVSRLLLEQVWDCCYPVSGRARMAETYRRL